MKTIRPNIVATVGKSYLRALFYPTPLWTHLYVTRHCNFDCQYCGARNNERKDPTYDEVREMILKLKTLGCNCVALMGGEPTLRPDIVKIVEFCSKNQVYTQLSTNGAYLINPLRSDNGMTLLERLVSAGLGIISLSVDSVASGFDISGKELPKSSEVLDALLKEQRESGLAVMLNCVISKKNIKQVPAMLEFCHKKGVMMAAIFVQNPNPTQKENKPGHLKEILFSYDDKKEVEAMADYLISKKKNSYRVLGPIQYYESIKKWIRGELNWQCDGGKYCLQVDTDGKVGICGYLPYLEKKLSELSSNFFDSIEETRNTHQKWCTKECLPSCMFCSAFYRQNPLSFLYTKFRYK